MWFRAPADDAYKEDIKNESFDCSKNGKMYRVPFVFDGLCKTYL